MTMTGTVRLSLAVSLSVVVSAVSVIVTASLGYADLMRRIRDTEAAIYGSVAVGEPGLRADMKSVDQRLVDAAANEQAMDKRLALLEAQFRWDTATRAAQKR
jgi:hypothetical protein